MNVLTKFLEEHPGHLSLVADYDPDGLSSAVLMERFLHSRQRDFSLRTPTRNRNIWDGDATRWLSPQSRAALVMDLGCRGDKLLPVPTLFLDHHQPAEPAPGDLLYTGYGRPVVPATAGLVWELVGEAVPEGLWLAAVGTYGDLGPKAPFPYLKTARERYTVKALGETVSLLNAARRFADPKIETALEALRQHEDPKALASSQADCVVELRRLRETVRRETDLAKQAAPTFAGEVALVKVHSSCQVHSIIAQIWRTRLPKYYVLVANTGYEDGMIHFSGRSSRRQKILAKLQSLDCWSPEAGFGQGHDQAAGGVVSPELWSKILHQLGFPEDV